VVDLSENREPKDDVENQAPPKPKDDDGNPASLSTPAPDAGASELNENRELADDVENQASPKPKDDDGKPASISTPALDAGASTALCVDSSANSASVVDALTSPMGSSKWAEDQVADRCETRPQSSNMLTVELAAEIQSGIIADMKDTEKASGDAPQPNMFTVDVYSSRLDKDESRFDKDASPRVQVDGGQPISIWRWSCKPMCGPQCNVD